MEIKESEKFCCLAMMMVYDEDALWKPASVSNKKQAAAVHCAIPVPLLPSDGPACHAWPGLCTRSTSSGLRAARLHSWGESNDYMKRTDITWALIFPEARYLKFSSHVAQADFLHLLTRDVIFQQEKKRLFALKSNDVAHQSLLCQLPSALQAS